MKYVIEQGIISKTGNGDMHIVATFENKADALELFERIKEDTKDWVYKHKSDLLVTELKRVLNDDEDNYSDETIRYHEYAK